MDVYADGYTQIRIRILWSEALQTIGMRR